MVALGRVAFDTALRLYTDLQPATFNQKPPPFAHNAACSLGPGLPTLIASYHPSRQNTQTGRLTAEMFDRVWAQVAQINKSANQQIADPGSGFGPLN